MPTIRCVRPPVQNLSQGIELGKPGEIIYVAELSHFWLGQIARGAVALVEDELPAAAPAIDEVDETPVEAVDETPADIAAELPAEPAPPPKSSVLYPPARRGRPRGKRK